MADSVLVPELVGRPVHIAREIAAEVGLSLASGDPDGPGLGSRTWPGIFWVTAQNPEPGSTLPAGSQIDIDFVADGEARSGVPSPTA